MKRNNNENLALNKATNDVLIAYNNLIRGAIELEKDQKLLGFVTPYHSYRYQFSKL